MTDDYVLISLISIPHFFSTPQIVFLIIFNLFSLLLLYLAKLLSKLSPITAVIL